MNLIVAKFGGTSVGTIERIQNVARIVSKLINLGNKVVVVVSAMSGVTNSIYENLRKVSERTRDLKEFDQAMVTGEQVSASLLSIALGELGFRAKSYNAETLPIHGDGDYGDGHITYVNDKKLQEDLENGIIPVITGFQGFKRSESSFITLGRGGSDYSAIMIAAALHAEVCYIYTDVDGVYSADPRIVANPLKINELTYDEMIQIALDGAKVLQTKSVLAAKSYNIEVEVLSSFDNHASGTKISNEAFLTNRNNLVVVSCNANLVLVSEYDYSGEKYDFSFTAKDCKKYFLVNPNLLLKSTAGTYVSKITTMNLDKGAILDLEKIKKLLLEGGIEVIHLEQPSENRIVLIVNSQLKERAVNIIHGEYYRS